MIKIKQILCPVDFSECSSHALTAAAMLAKAHGASLAVVHVAFMPLPVAPMPLEGTVPIDFTLTPVQREHLGSVLAEFVHARVAGAPATSEVIEAPVVHTEIVAQASRLHADLIVMGTHGRSGFQRLFLGSVTEKVVRTAPQPVLTVGARSADQEGSAFRRILCGIDFSDYSLAGFDYALTLAEGSKAEIVAVNVIEWTPIGYDPLIGPPTDLVGYRLAAEAEGRKRLHDAIADARPHQASVEELVVSGKPHRELLRIAAERGVDLIVLGVHGRNPVDRMLFGSTVEPLLRRAECPVLTVRSAAFAGLAAA
jgi:nucleotide-binding universal stress UspA family protein